MPIPHADGLTWLSNYGIGVRFLGSSLIHVHGMRAVGETGSETMINSGRLLTDDVDLGLGPAGASSGDVLGDPI